MANKEHDSRYQCRIYVNLTSQGYLQYLIFDFGILFNMCPGTTMYQNDKNNDVSWYKFYIKKKVCTINILFNPNKVGNGTFQGHSRSVSPGPF